MLGHSAGEIACGYGDGCFTREQCVLVAYHRGRMCPEHNISGGLMAAVGLGVEDAEARLAKHGQPGCVVGCDNSPNTVTLSGVIPTPSPLPPYMLCPVPRRHSPSTTWRLSKDRGRLWTRCTELKMPQAVGLCAYCRSEEFRQPTDFAGAMAECLGAVTGPEEEIKPLLEQLKAEGVFVRELDTRGLAFHSPVLQSHLGELKEGEQQTQVPSYVRW